MAEGYLTLGQRRETERMNEENVRPCETAQAVGMTVATICRELKRGLLLQSFP